MRPADRQHRLHRLHETRGQGRRTRPVMFAFNGGPGSSSLWLTWACSTAACGRSPIRIRRHRRLSHRRQTSSAFSTRAICHDRSRGTGISRAVCDHKDEEFWASDPDIDSLSRFIAQYVSDNNRWTSPKYPPRESYGTTRGALSSTTFGPAPTDVQRSDPCFGGDRHRSDFRRACPVTTGRMPCTCRACGRGLVSPHAAEADRRSRAVPRGVAPLCTGSVHGPRSSKAMP